MKKDNERIHLYSIKDIDHISPAMIITLKDIMDQVKDGKTEEEAVEFVRNIYSEIGELFEEELRFIVSIKEQIQNKKKGSNVK
jgi:hypothetical protein